MTYTKTHDRIQRVIWSDILMAQDRSAVFTYEKVKMTGPTTIPAKPAVYTVTIAKSGNSTNDKTLIIGGVTFTAKTTPATAGNSGADVQYALNATATEIATLVKNKGLTNYTVTVSGNVLTYTQTTAGTGNAVTIGEGTDATITATVAPTQEYAATNSTNPEYNIEPGEPLYLVSVGTDGVKTVAPINVTETLQISAFCGFSKASRRTKRSTKRSWLARVVSLMSTCSLTVTSLGTPFPMITRPARSVKKRKRRVLFLVKSSPKNHSNFESKEA